ncbi:CPBP family intramembrane glutamic endopeptidase [Rikenella microfusus]|uniref:Exosortase E/protease, VPEID-CTERM system n=1 Tax=Rikenella microfusus TaxID=28139 RepID=A0A379MVA8_9BACT|nr:type II CAAX endopeptidase family protein [Rikenella microfusus]SUE34810.1 exosortase E/protease, VPEID-CTERM system [Rikenella microfusus]
MPDTFFPRSLWFPILSILAVYVAASMLLGLILGNLGTLYDPTFWSFAAYAGSFFVTIGYAVALRGGWGLEIPSFHPEKWKANPRLIVAGVILMLATGIVLTPVLDRLPDTYIERLDEYMQGGFWPMFTAVVAAPILEEFLFRGIIQKNLVLRLGPLWGILLGSLIFGGIHLVPQQVVYASCLGLILGSVYYLTGSLNSAIAVHFVNNGLTSLLYMFFGTSDSLERRILGEGPLWDWAYGISLLLLLAAGWYTVARIRRRERQTSPRTPDSAEN